MKKLLLSACMAFLSFIACAQSDYRVVFDLTSNDTADHRALLRWATSIASEVPGSRVEIVLYGKALNFVIADQAAFPDAIRKLLAMENASIKACAASLRNNNVDAARLIPGVELVPDGIYEIIQKQREGWGYIKATR